MDATEKFTTEASRFEQWALHGTSTGEVAVREDTLGRTWYECYPGITRWLSANIGYLLTRDSVTLNTAIPRIAANVPCRCNSAFPSPILQIPHQLLD